MKLVYGVVALLITAACGDQDAGPGVAASGAGADGGGGGGGGGNGTAAGGAGGEPCAAGCASSNIEHLIVVIQENHTFDNHFGKYCKAAPGSAPACNDGPECCEAGPATDPGSGSPPTVLDDEEHGAYDPDHSMACEVQEINGGKMDGFVTGPCGNTRNFAYADPAIVQPYWDIAAVSALADRYFQSVAGASSSNDMYLARAGFVFPDNQYEPKGSVGLACIGWPTHEYADPTIGDLLNDRGVPWAFYAEGYDAMAAAEAAGDCGTPPPDCPAAVPTYPCVFDPGDVPFQYYTSLRDDPATMRDLSAFNAALTGGTLPAVSFLKVLGYRTEHPGGGTKLSVGIASTVEILDAVAASPYAASSLVVVTYDEGGGYFDHVPTPPDGPVDGKPYGTRLPTFATGPFARKNFVSHVPLEHASIVRFIEWNWLGRETGQLGQRDTAVPNLGSLLDPAATGAAVPED